MKKSRSLRCVAQSRRVHSPRFFVVVLSARTGPRDVIETRSISRTEANPGDYLPGAPHMYTPSCTASRSSFTQDKSFPVDKRREIFSEVASRAYRARVIRTPAHILRINHASSSILRSALSAPIQRCRRYNVIKARFASETRAGDVRETIVCARGYGREAPSHGQAL